MCDDGLDLPRRVLDNSISGFVAPPRSAVRGGVRLPYRFLAESRRERPPTTRVI